MKFIDRFAYSVEQISLEAIPELCTCSIEPSQFAIIRSDVIVVMR